MFVISDRGKYRTEWKIYFCWEEIDFCIWESIVCINMAVNCSHFFGRDSFSRLSVLHGLLKWLTSIIHYICASTISCALVSSVYFVAAWDYKKINMRSHYKSYLLILKCYNKTSDSIGVWHRIKMHLIFFPIFSVKAKVW